MEGDAREGQAGEFTKIQGCWRRGRPGPAHPPGSVSAQVWRQKAQYLQHKQNKAEATTIKHKSSGESKGKVSATGAGVVSPSRAAGAVTLSPARVPEVDPIDAAAHLQLLGESLSLIGHRLQETEVRF